MSVKRQELIETAIKLFSKHGFHGTGIDRIADEANVSKKTMYHHFRSKEELILAALRQHDGLFRNHFMKAVNQTSDNAYDRLLNIFDVAHAWFSGKEFYGCMFINAIGEYSEPNTSIRQVCKEFKRSMIGYIEELAGQAELSNPHEIASSLGLLLEGSIVTAQVSGDPNSASTAKQAAKVIVDSARKE